MSVQDRPTARRALLAQPRYSFRMRLTMTYALLLTGSGAVMLTLVYVLVVLVPNYSFQPVATLTSAPQQPFNKTQDTSERTLTDSVPGIVVASRADLQELLLWISLGLLVLLAVAGAVIGWRVAGRMLRPLQAVNLAAQRAANGQLDARLGMGPARDEVTELAATFDRMLDGLESSFHAHQRFAANASHELRTPLATTRAVIDVAMPTATPEQQRTLRGLRELNERSINTVSALLQLADIEAPVAHRFVGCDLSALAESAVAELRVEAETAEVSVRLSLSSDAVTLADEALLPLVVRNLIQNAVRHNSAGGWVLVRTAVVDERVVCEVSNSGAAVTSEQLETLRAPFQRASERVGIRGHGLGLAIVDAILARHESELLLRPREGGGVTAAFSLPQAASTE